MVNSTKKTNQAIKTRFSDFIKQVGEKTVSDIKSLGQYNEYCKGLYYRFNHEQAKQVSRGIKNELGYDATKKAMDNKTFDNFQIKNLTHNELVTSLKIWNFSKLGMYILGNMGSGKSHLMTAFRKSLFERDLLKGKKLRLFTHMSLMHSLKDFDSRRYVYGQEISCAEYHKKISESCDLLIIDDFGAGRMTDYEVDLTLDILEERIKRNNRTFMTSNLTMEQVQTKFGARIVERILEHMVIRRCQTNESHRWSMQRINAKRDE